MPGLPISKSQLDKLGDRLRDSAQPTGDDLDLLEAVLSAYDEALQVVATRLRDRGMTPTTRLKTTGTIIDKLRRDRSSSLKTIQDLAGARVVVAGGLLAQDAHAQTVMEVLYGEPQPLLIDRRRDPRAGYRAVHVIGKIDGLPVEVQIRTELQDLWAQIFERLADVCGRQIRYGGQPDPVPSVARQGNRQKLVDLMLGMSDLIGVLETNRAERTPLSPAVAPVLSADVEPDLRQVQFKYGRLFQHAATAGTAVREMLTDIADIIDEQAEAL